MEILHEGAGSADYESQSFNMISENHTAERPPQRKRSVRPPARRSSLDNVSWQPRIRKSNEKS